MKHNLNIIKSSDASLSFIKNKTIGIIGYGNQGRAHALNLKDRGLDIIVGLRDDSKTKNNDSLKNIEVLAIREVVLASDIICLLLPDTALPKVYEKNIKNFLKNGQTLVFAHGFNVHYNLISLPEYVDVVMVAPSGGGAVVRESFLKGSGVPSLIAVHQNFSGIAFDIAKAYSRALGCTRVCSFVSTFKEETETDLYGEQAILTGGLPMMIESSLKVLLEEGYSLEVAWFVCYYELTTIVDLFHKNGFEYLYNAISDTAKVGGLKSGNFLIDEAYENKLKQILLNIKSGKFKDDLIDSKLNFDYKSKLSLKDQSRIKDLMKLVFNKKEV